MSGSNRPFTAYDASFERMQASGIAPEDAARLVVEDYLVGKPRLRGKKKVSKAERDEAFWNSAVICALPTEWWAAEPFTLALVRYFSQDRVANIPLLSRLAQSLPDTVCYAVRRSELVLRSTSPRLAELAGVADLAPEIAELCRVLEIFEAAHQLRIAALEKSRARLSELTPFELLIYASLHAFHTLVPRNMGTTALDEGDEHPSDQEFWDAVTDLVSWKLCARDGTVLVLELKSTYLRRSSRDAWLHSTTTLRKAGIQLRRKVAAVQRALRDIQFSEMLALNSGEEKLCIQGWIVDTSIECDHQRFEGFLKVSLEEVLIALRDDSYLLQDPAGLLRGNFAESALPDMEDPVSKSLYPEGFSAPRFVEVIERAEVWKGMEGC